ncbi:MAG: Rne/Rng family ribonuclease [Gaiellaceae bacterium]
MSWFRRKQTKEQAPQEAAAPTPPAAAVAAEPAARPPDDGAAGESTTTTTPRKRSRGSRGGRGRSRRPAGAAATATAAAKAPAAEEPEKKPARQRAERKPRAQPRRRTPPRRAPLPPAKRELLVSVDVSEQRVAVLEDGKVAEVYLERPERRSIAGNIYLGTVDNVLPGMEAAFIEIGLEKNGFLYVDEIVRDELEGTREGKKIQDLLSRGESVLVQAVKDPMKTKGARLTMEISLPGRFVVFVPHGDGLGVSRRLPDDERARLKEIVKGLDVKQGGVIVRTAAEGASAEDVERDLVFVQRLWKTIEAQAKKAKAPALVYQEAELPLRITRDLFTGDFERAFVDNDRAYRRIVGYLKKTSPHMVERVERYKEKAPLFDSFGVEDEIRSTLNRRVDLPSGGYLVFDYAEAFTVVDVNTGRFVGSRSKTSPARLEDTITKNNLEAVKEVVRQLRLRDVGGIIVIDFIDMANPKNREAVEEALRTELERDRTKTYVVEISPLGLVEMTRQNVTDGPREILTKKCPTCGGDGIVISEATAAVDIERRLRELAQTPRVQAFRVELHPRVAAILIGPGGARLSEIEAGAKRRFFLETTDNGHSLDHFAVLAQGRLEELKPEAPVEEGQELELKLVEVGLHDARAGVAKVDGFDVCVADAASLVGKKVKLRVERVLAAGAYAVRLDARPEEQPLSAEAAAEKPTRQPAKRKTEAKVEVEAEEAEEVEEVEQAEEAEEIEAVAEEETPPEERPKKKTRRGSRGGRRRKKPAAATAEVTVEAPSPDGSGPRIHVPPPELGEPEEEVAATAEGAPAAGQERPRKKTRRGSRGGRRRKKKPATVSEETAPS